MSLFWTMETILFSISQLIERTTMTKDKRLTAKKLFQQLEKYEAPQRVAEHGGMGGEAILFRTSPKNQLRSYEPELAKLILEWVSGKLESINVQLEKL